MNQRADELMSSSGPTSLDFFRPVASVRPFSAQPPQLPKLSYTFVLESTSIKSNSQTLSSVQRQQD